jgi:hypothetical protein
MSLDITIVPPVVSEFRTSFTPVSGHRSHLSQGVNDGDGAAGRHRGVVEGRSKSEVSRQYGVSRRWVITLVQRYLAEGDAGRAKLHVLPYWGGWRIGDIRPSDIDDWVAQLSKRMGRGRCGTATRCCGDRCGGR